MRITPTAIAVAALPLLAAACSSVPTAGTHAPASASSSTADPDAGLLTGTQMNAALRPASFFPPGFTLDPSGSVNTGPGFQPASPATGVAACTRLGDTSWVDMAGPGPVAFAQNDYINNRTREEDAQEIDAYPGTQAQAVMAGLRKVAQRCPSFPVSQVSSPVTVKLLSGPALGDDALTILLSNPQFAGGTALEAVRVGTSVITVLCSVNSGTGLSQATALATAITASVKAGK
jgi:hypothetical protein